MKIEGLSGRRSARTHAGDLGVIGSGRKPQSLAERLRPQTWDEVFGYATDIEYLRNEAALAKDPEDARAGGRSVLISGPPGVGKSVLGELYGRALHCSEPGGDPCGICWDCEQWRDRNHLNLRILNGAFGNSASFAADVNETIESGFDGNGRLVVLIDEAELLAPSGWSLLHDRIERPPWDVTFIVCSGRPIALAERHRELFREIELRGLSITDREPLLRRAAEVDGLEIDEAGLVLLARLGGERPRALLNHLEILALRGPVTADEVRAHFLDPRTERALIYFERVLARASLSDQLAAMHDEGGLSPGDVGEVVRGVLTSLLGAPALGLADENMPIAFESARARGDLAIALLERRTALGLTPQQMFSRLVAWWSAPIEDEYAFIARANDFDEWLNGPGHLVEVGIENGTRAVERRRRQKDELRALEVGRAAGVVGRRDQGASEKFLSEMDVQRIWDAASYLIQKHGLFLSGRLSVCWGPGGDEDEAAFSTAITELQRELGLWAIRQVNSETKDKDVKFHYVRVHARDTDGTRWTHWGVACRPDLNVQAWMKRYRNRRRGPLASAAQVEWDPGPLTGRDPLRRHQEVLAYLLAGIDPLWRVTVADESGRGVERAVSELLGIRTLQPAGPAFLTPRTFASRFIDRKYRSEAGKILPALSIFDKRKWGSALSGWEVQEHKYRVQQEAEYARRVSQFERDWPKEDVEMKERREAERGGLETRWAGEEQLRIARRPGIPGGA